MAKEISISLEMLSGASSLLNITAKEIYYGIEFMKAALEGGIPIFLTQLLTMVWS